MALIEIVQAYLLANSNRIDEKEEVLELVEQLEFLYNLYSDSDSEYSDVFTDDESDEEFTPEELQELNNIRIGRDGEFYQIN